MPRNLNLSSECSYVKTIALSLNFVKKNSPKQKVNKNNPRYNLLINDIILTTHYGLNNIITDNKNCVVNFVKMSLFCIKGHSHWKEISQHILLQPPFMGLLPDAEMERFCIRSSIHGKLQKLPTILVSNFTLGLLIACVELFRNFKNGFT